MHFKGFLSFTGFFYPNLHINFRKTITFLPHYIINLKNPKFSTKLI